jgi:hypothetical protein
MPARLAMDRTHRWAVRRSRRLPSWRSRIGPVVPLADGQVDGASRSRHQRDQGGLVALADDAQGPMAPLESEVLDVGRARLTDPQAVEVQEHGQGGVGVVDPLSCEQELPELGSVEAAGVSGMNLGSANVLRCVGGNPPIEVGEAIEAAHRR